MEDAMDTQGLIGAHTSVMVDDVEASVDHLSATLPFEFKAPARIPFEVSGVDGNMYEQQVRACYSTDGTIELVEAADSGPFAGSIGSGIHHYGGLVGDLEAAVAKQLEAGNEVEWKLSYDGQLIAVFFRGGGALPGRLELVTAQAPPLLDMFAESK
jgi:hypothetical protein